MLRMVQLWKLTKIVWHLFSCHMIAVSGGMRYFGDAVSAMDVSAMEWNLDQRCCFQISELTHSVNPVQLLQENFCYWYSWPMLPKNFSDVHKKAHLTFYCKHCMWVGVCLWENSAIPLRQTRVRVRPEAIHGTLLLEHEFALWEATGGCEMKSE